MNPGSCREACRKACKEADMAELADALDLGSSISDVGVRVPLSALARWHDHRVHFRFPPVVLSDVGTNAYGTQSGGLPSGGLMPARGGQQCVWCASMQD